MSKSKAFSLIRTDVIKIANAIPVGKVTTYKNIGEYMTVMPRHVAYILSQLKPEEQDEVAWHRIVGESGTLGKDRSDARGRRQSELLEEDAVEISNGAVSNFSTCFVSVESLISGVEPGKNYSK